jgi:hypothetical protein
VSGGPGAGKTIVGFFLILFGLCITFLGGGCAAFFILEMFGSHSDPESAGYVMIALLTFGAGVLLLRVSIRMLRGKRDEATEKEGLE